MLNGILGMLANAKRQPATVDMKSMEFSCFTESLINVKTSFPCHNLCISLPI